MKCTAKRLVLIVASLMLSLTLSGCLYWAARSKLPWAVNIYSYDLMTVVTTPYGDKSAGSDYQWLAVEVTVANKTSATVRLNPLVYEFSLIMNGSYKNQLVYDKPIGGLEWSRDIQPGQTIRGDLYFEIPASLDHLPRGAELKLRDKHRDYIVRANIGSVPRR